MTIYIRTAAGQDAALNSKSSLPRKLRTLLISIDGRTTASTYVDNLSSFGDVNGLLNTLLGAELIEVLTAKKSFDSVRPNDLPKASLVSPAQSPLSSSFIPSLDRKLTSPAADQYQLRRAISLMSDFVQVNLPGQSMEIVLALENMAAVEQVVKSLESYEAMIAHIGTPAKTHLAEVRQLIATF